MRAHHLLRFAAATVAIGAGCTKTPPPPPSPAATASTAAPSAPSAGPSSAASVAAAASAAAPAAAGPAIVGREEKDGVGHLTAPRRAVHAYARAGDLLLFGAQTPEGRVVLSFGASPDLPGHRPLKGALLDVGLADASGAATDAADPVLWIRTAWVDAQKTAHILLAESARPEPCGAGSSGILVTGKKDGVGLTTKICPRPDGAFNWETKATDLPAGASIADEVHPGTAEPSIQGKGPAWEGEHPTGFVEFAEHGVRVRVEDGAMRAQRRLVHIAGESFPAPLVLSHPANPATRVVRVTRDRVPPEAPLAPNLTLRFTDGAGGPLPVHVLFKGEDGTANPAIVSHDPDVHTAERSVYLPRGYGKVFVPPGKYTVVATHGPAWTLEKKSVVVTDQRLANPVSGVLARVVAPPGWVAADFHLHAAPSPDSTVSLDARVATLMAEGVDFAVATDHNRVTDYGPSRERLGATALTTMMGCEITSAGTPPLGHFNAFPLPMPAGAPDDGVPLYFETPAGKMFGSARSLGAKVIQVNHARMPPSIGYFDLTKLEPATGKATAAFSEGFDALEAHNGLWLENRGKTREGAVDLVALARRGMKVAATGNSDSHRVLYEEAGWPRTWVKVGDGPEPLGDRVLAALQRRETSVSAGPFVEMTVDGKPIGAIVTPAAKGQVKVRVRVHAPAWIPVEKVEIWRDDQVAHTFDVPGPAVDGVRFDKEVVVDAPRDVTLLAWVEAEAPIPHVLPLGRARPIAFTGLTWVDANGDGKVDIAPR